MEATTDPGNMGRTTIQVSEELADELHKRKQRGDSYEDVIWQLLGEEQPEEGSDEERATEPTNAPREPPTASQEPETTPEPGADRLPEEIEARVWAIVDDVAEGWDEDSRLEKRRQAAANVLQHAVNTGETVGKSHPVVDHVIAEFPVEGQNRETYWRQNVRDVLAEVGDYSRGKHGYTVEEGGLDG
jgi:hypothetical protein